MTYCTIDEAKAQGARGSFADITAAIVAAQERIDRFTGDLFEPATRTVVARLGGDGRAMLPMRLTDADSVDTVEYVDGAAVEATMFRAYSSADTGDVDAIGVGRDYVGTNILVVGLEPWADHTNRPGRLRVTGTFGWAETPAAVRTAAALLAGHISRLAGPGDASPTGSQTTTDVDPEGNVVPVVPPFADDETADVAGARTTGVRSVDATLLPFRRFTGMTGV